MIPTRGNRPGWRDTHLAGVDGVELILVGVLTPAVKDAHLREGKIIQGDGRGGGIARRTFQGRALGAGEATGDPAAAIKRFWVLIAGM